MRFLPNCFAVSKQGYGRTAVSAVLGANVFYPTVVFAPSWFFAAFAVNTIILVTKWPASKSYFDIVNMVSQ